MPITFPCPSCGKTLSVPTTAVGKSARCPECKNLTPVTAASTEQQPPPPPVPAIDDKKNEESLAPSKERIRKRPKSNKQKEENSKSLVAIVFGLLALGILGTVTVIVAAVFVLRSDEPAPTVAVAAAPAPNPEAAPTTHEQKRFAETPPPKVPLAGPENSNLIAVQAEKPAGAFTARGECELALIYTADFKQAKDTHVCIRLRQPDPFASVLCYAPRDSEDGKKLTELFANGDRRIMTLECELGHESAHVAKINHIKEIFAMVLPPSNVPRIGAIDPTTASTSHWFAMLTDSNKSRSSTARDRLKSMGAAAIPDMRRVLFDTDPRVRVALASLLGEMGQSAHVAVDDLARALSDEDASVRATAARSLGNFAAAAHSALLPLVVASTDSDSTASSAATSALEHIGPIVAADLDKLQILWKQPDAEKRERCINTLRSLKPDSETTAQLFSPLLADKETSVRVKAIQALGDAGPSAHARLFPKLLPWCADEDANIRQAAIEALGKLGPAVGADYEGLKTALKSKQPETRIFCIERLADLAEAAAPSAADIATMTHDDDPKLRAASLRALTRVAKSSPETMVEVLKALKDRELAVRLTSIELISQFGREKGVVDALFAGLDDELPEMRAASIKALTGLEPRLGRDEQALLSKALKSSQMEVRRFAATEFARIGANAAESLNDLVAAASDSDFETRRYVFAALAAHGPKAAAAAQAVLDTISEIVKNDAKMEGSTELLAQASATLAKIDSPNKAIPILSSGLKLENATLRKAAIQALGEIGPGSRTAAKDLCALVGDSEAGSVVSEALLKIRGEEVVKALCDVAEYDRSVAAKLAAIQVLGKMGADAKGAYQTLVGLVRRNKGKEVGNAASEALKLIR